MRIRWLLVSIVLAAAAAGAGFFLRRPRLEAPIVGTRLFQTVLSFVRDQLVDTLTDEEIYRLAASGLVTELDDPYAALLLPGRRRTASEAEAAPLGLHLDRRDGSVVVVAAMPGSPAERAGVRSGDEVLGVGNTPVEPERLEEVIALIGGRGAGSTLLRLRRPGEGPLSIEIEAEAVALPPAVSGRMIGEGMALLRIARMPKGAGDSVARALRELQRAGMRSLVVDLRRTVGGALADAVAVADHFFDGQTILATTRGRTPADSVRYVDSTPTRLREVPIVVLVDQGTAGAAEALAGALQDHDRAAVLGWTTFGRGVTQREFDLGAGAAVRLTTGVWITPAGRQIQVPRRPEDADSAPRPSVRTAGGHTLLGGGGIVPHQLIADTGAVDRPLEAARALLARSQTPTAVLSQIAH